MRIRLADESDAEQILRIYRPYVIETWITFELEPPSVSEVRKRIRDTRERAPWLVSEREGEITGYAYAGRFNPRAAYQWTVETTVYVDRAQHRRGVGRALYTSLLDCLRVQGYCTAIGIIALPNAASIGLHESLGFRAAGTFPSVGYKLGGWRDVGWWQLRLKARPRSPTPPMGLAAAVRTADWSRAMEKGEMLLRAVKRITPSP
jgi:L-amino acid N-acyltransferase YncA